MDTAETAEAREEGAETDKGLRRGVAAACVDTCDEVGEVGRLV